MNMKIKIAESFALVALAVCFLFAGALGQTLAEPRGEAALFGMNTASAGQTMRLSVVNRLPVSDREIIPCVRVKIVVDFYVPRCDGSVCPAPFRRAERSLTLDPGEAVSFDLASSRTGGERFSVSVFMSPVEESDASSAGNTATATLEVIESGRKLFNLPGIIKGFDPQPDPPR